MYLISEQPEFRADSHEAILAWNEHAVRRQLYSWFSTASIYLQAREAFVTEYLRQRGWRWL